jgi:hypothetical protein
MELRSGMGEKEVANVKKLSPVGCRSEEMANLKKDHKIFQNIRPIIRYSRAIVKHVLHERPPFFQSCPSNPKEKLNGIF